MKILAIIGVFLVAKKPLIEAGSVAIVGVHPSEQHLYQPMINERTGEKQWHCLNDNSITLSYDQINDNFCDCPDGSDEPGTNACPYNPDRKFYCANEGHIQGYIENFKLNDGVCDYEICCDGSDEYLTGKCENKCNQINQQFVGYKKEVTDDINKSLTIKQELIDKAKDTRIEIEKMLESLKVDLKKKKEESEMLERRLEEEEEAKSQVDEDGSIEISVFEKLSPHISELSNNIQLQGRKLKEKSERIRHLENILSKLIKEYNPNFNDLAVKETVNSFQEYLSNREEEEDETSNSSEILEKIANESKELNHKPQEHVGSIVPTFNNMLHFYFTSLADSFLQKPDYDLGSGKSVNSRKSLKLVEQISGKIEELERSIQSIKSEITIYEEDLEKDYGPNDIFRSVQSLWISDRLGEYNYKLSYLDSIYQDNLLIGRFSGLDGNKLFYKNGAKCWNGPNRSAEVELICGSSHQLISVSEPEKCEYYFELISPIICDEITDDDIIANFKIKYELL